MTQVRATTSDEKAGKQFCKKIASNLQSENQGVRLSALMHIIRYADQIDFTNAHNEVMDIFLFNENAKIRQLALTALHKINVSTDMNFLLIQKNFEKDPDILRHIIAVLLDCGKMQLVPKNNEQRMAGQASKEPVKLSKY